MPDYDYEEFDRRQAEWEEKRAAMDAGTYDDSSSSEGSSDTVEEKEIESEDDISW